MKRKDMLTAYETAMQALALTQIAGHMAKHDEMQSWQALEMFKTLHDLIGDFSGILAEALDNLEARK